MIYQTENCALTGLSRPISHFSYCFQFHDAGGAIGAGVNPNSLGAALWAARTDANEQRAMPEPSPTCLAQHLLQVMPCSAVRAFMGASTSARCCSL